MKKGQVSTEYLVILAVVLVIALVVVFLVSQGTGVGTSTLDSQTQAYWKGVQPLSILDYSATGTTLTVAIQNNAQESITLTQVAGSGLTAYAVSTTFAPGQARTIPITLTATCGTAGTRFSYSNVTFTYDVGLISGKTFAGQRALSGACS